MMRLGPHRRLGSAARPAEARRRCIAVLVAIAGIHAAAAQEPPRPRAPDTVVVFHIPAQPLASALQVYGEKARVQVLYESSSAAGRRSAAVDGNFRPEEALLLLLTGTDLRVRYTRPDAVTLALVPSDAAAAGPLPSADLSLGTLRVRPTGEDNDPARLRDYSDSLQADIQKVLQRNADTRDGSYRAVLELWIDPLRTVQRIDVVHSTGNERRDSAVAKVLRGLTVSRPTPANTPQPVRIVIVVRSLQ